jgi:hypothetical protein
MALIISSFLPFPNLQWWAQAAEATTVYFDQAEHFEKMTFRNRYTVAGANGPIKLSIPLDQGRDQRAAMCDVRISNGEKWQLNHWRTISSVYRRAPYFEHYEHSLQQLFDQPYTHLPHFCLATVQLLRQHAGFTFQVGFADAYLKQYTAEYTDLRGLKPASDKSITPAYYQLFAERNGFVPNLSLLDLLFSEGPYTANWIKDNLTI